jgi:hypothetical protein
VEKDKNYRAGCSRLWFERQLSRLAARLYVDKQQDLLNVFQLWVKSLDIDFPEKITDKMVAW